MANEANKPEAPRPQTPTEVIQENERTIAKRNAESSAAAEKPSGFVVAPGKSLATPRGIVSEGQTIGVYDFEDEKFFKQRQSEGYIVPASEAGKK